jgi:hypothetical protein
VMISSTDGKPGTAMRRRRERIARGTARVGLIAVPGAIFPGRRDGSVASIGNRRLAMGGSNAR